MSIVKNYYRIYTQCIQCIYYIYIYTTYIVEMYIFDILARDHAYFIFKSKLTSSHDMI